MHVLSVRGLRTIYRTPEGDALALDGIDLDLSRGEMLGIIGESGCGKTTAGFSILRSVKFPGVMTGGSVVLDGVDLAALPPEELRKRLGKDITMIPQCAMNALDPSWRVGDQIAEAIETHEPEVSPQKVRERVQDLLRSVGLNREWARAYPHKLSGGMKQRVVIAMALACNPKVIVADESTTGLDVLVQAQILSLLRSVQKERNLGVLLISHDLPMVADICDHIGIMYAGSLVELGTVEEIVHSPMHPYTKALLGSQIRLADLKTIVQPVEGTVPSLVGEHPGCRFRPRCALGDDGCEGKKPALYVDGGTHSCACFKAEALHGR
ncbi:MAG TPA: ABC transporter ATP-binding protein [Magnetospirillaceae bacterium]|nr:ABC transporter ATP-binding protein [Magnetospirillaceae bacterium]